MIRIPSRPLHWLFTAAVCLSIPVALPARATEIFTEAFTPTPISINLADLPKPFSTPSASYEPPVVPPPAQPSLRLPAGFQVSVFARDLEEPRWLALTPEGGILVTESAAGRIRLLEGLREDGSAERGSVFATPENGLNLPFGMAFAQGRFFVANTDAILAFSYQRGQRRLGGRGERIAPLPGGGHWTRALALSPDERRLYVSIGSRTNADVEPAPRASIVRIPLPKGKVEPFASGLRNPVGLAFEPNTGILYTVVNERDQLGDDLVPDYLARVRQGDFFGWPYAYLSPHLLDPRLLVHHHVQKPNLVDTTRTPDVLFQAHSAPLGLAFPSGRPQFPERYLHGAFVALHGSWNRSEPTGYKIVFVPFGNDHRPQGFYEDFLTGFLSEGEHPKTWGRPVGLLFLPDGSLLFSDDANGFLYRITYERDAER
ncbi:sorbosone dehydrogenase family protein [Methylacidimicrobium sp. B4]|uniref:PQQ-dependent sugar dehydrogenase n=1 Tax=Methylacidimicrobium sp. B4 TaxID=2796139 RepID=UPI001A900698|nr:PQQ-dependent sugar dehydrogenase [Methylacidimicrobium sp. B4]QSR84572.1 sorbosone dehydrogenase family protein [Methylacidimicrobium sp. B4]